MPLTFSDALIAAKNSRANKEPLVWLAQLDMSDFSPPAGAEDVLATWAAADVAYFAFHDADVTYGGITYRAIAGRVEDAKHEAGTLLEQTVTLAGVDRRLSVVLESGGILDAAVTLLQVSMGSLSDAAHHRSLRYLVKSATVGADTVSFRLGSPLLMDRLLPAHRFIRYRCRFAFKDALTCGYSGIETTCDKSYDLATGCAGRDNQGRYGGFPTLLSGPNPWLL